MMKTLTENKPGTGQSASDQIFSVKDSLMNRVLLIGLVAAVLATAVSIARVKIAGFQFIYVFDILVIAVLWILIHQRKRVPYNVRLSTVVVLVLLVSCAGFWGFGLLGYGDLILTGAILLTATFGSRKMSFLVTGTASAIVVLFGILYSTGVAKLVFDIQTYHHSLVSWLNRAIGLVVFGSVFAAITTSLINKIMLSSRQLEENLVQIKLLNETLEQKVELRTTQLAQSNKDKDRILGVVAHDIKNKLVGILGYLDMLEQDHSVLSDKDRVKYIENALESCILAKEIVNDILEFSRGQAGDQTLITESVDLCSFVLSTVECHMPKALDKKVVLRMGSSPQFAFARVNRSKLSRVIDNLVTNALKFTLEGGTVTVDIQKRPEGILVAVSDSGIGIPDVLKPNIFQPFSSSGRPGTAKEKSTGLGLSISKKIVEQHSGKIWFESEEGKGSTFYLVLPNDSDEEGKTEQT